MQKLQHESNQIASQAEKDGVKKIRIAADGTEIEQDESDESSSGDFDINSFKKGIQDQLDALDQLDETVLKYMDEESTTIEKSKKKSKQKSGGNLKHLVVPENKSSLENSDNEVKEEGPKHQR